MHTREAPEGMDTQALLVEAANLATIIRSGIDKSTQPDLIDRFADVLTELGMQRSYTNAHGTTLTEAQKKMLEPWFILLSSSSGHMSVEETETTIIPAAKQVTQAIKNVMHTPSKPVPAPPPVKPPLPQRKAPIGVPKKKEAPLPNIHAPSDINTPFAELFGQPKKAAAEPLPSAPDTVSIAEEAFVPPVYTQEELLQQCEDCVERFPGEDRMVILNKTKLLTSVMDILLQETTDPTVEAKVRSYYALLIEERQQRQPAAVDVPVAETPPAAPAAKAPDNEPDLKERFVINDVMRLTAMQRQIFQQKMKEIEEGDTGNFSQEIHLEEIASRLASRGLFHKDEFSEKDARQYLKEMHANIRPKEIHSKQKENTPPVDPDALTKDDLEQADKLKAEDEYDSSLPDHLPDGFDPPAFADADDLSSILAFCAKRKVLPSKEYRDLSMSEYLSLPKFLRLTKVYDLFCASAAYSERPFNPVPFTEGMTLLLDIVKHDRLEYGFANILYSIAKEKCGVPPAYDSVYKDMLLAHLTEEQTPQSTSNNSLYRLLDLIADTSHD